MLELRDAMDPFRCTGEVRPGDGGTCGCCRGCLLAEDCAQVPDENERCHLCGESNCEQYAPLNGLAVPVHSDCEDAQRRLERFAADWSRTLEILSRGP